MTIKKVRTIDRDTETVRILDDIMGEMIASNENEIAELMALLEGDAWNSERR